MGQTVPSQHPAVVLRSHFNQLRALLAVALIAMIGLTVAVVILASGRPESARLPHTQAQALTGSRYDGGPEEDILGIRHSSAAPGAASPQASETPGTAAARKQVEIGRSITDPDEYLAFVESLADYNHARSYGDKR
jgi:hypothetical protein